MMSAVKHKWDTSWTEAQVRALLAEESLTYQNIELPYGLSTGGHDRSPTCARIFPADMTGKTVLDVGSKYGYFCFEALRRGAKRAVGLDIDEDSLRKARRLAECLNAPAEFHRLNIEEDEFNEKFDYVLCLNVIHHLKNPLSAIERLAALTGERLVLEVADIGPHDRKKLGLSLFQSMVLNRAPVLYVGRSLISDRYSPQTFFIARAALENLLLHQRKSFSHLDVFDSDFKSRYIAIAHKRSVNRLLVVAGPTSAGKSTFIKRLLRGEARDVAEHLKFGDPASWEMTSAQSVGKLKKSQIENLILHYDTLRPVKRKIKDYRSDNALDLISEAKEVTFLTLWVEPEQLLKQLEESEVRRYTGGGLMRKEKRIKKRQTLQIWEDYKKPERIAEYYRRWFAFAETIKAPHLVVTATDDEPRAHRAEEFARRFLTRDLPVSPASR